MWRDHSDLREARCCDIDGGDPLIHCADDLGQAELGFAESGGISVRLFGEAANGDAFDFRELVRCGYVFVLFSTDDVGVHAAPRDLFADLVHEEEVCLLEG